MKDHNHKVKTLAELKPVIQKLKAAKKKIVLGHGVFDLLHYGHIHYLQQAKKLGDVLIVSMVVDKFVQKGPNRPVFHEEIRARSLAAIAVVDFVVPCEDFGPWGIIKTLRPNIYAKGEDSQPQLKNLKSGLNRDKRLVRSVGGDIRFTKSLPIHSAELLKSHFSALAPETNDFLARFRKEYPVSTVINQLEQLQKLRVLVIGEAIIDEYRYVTPLGKANKAHIISTEFLSKEEFAGGALACANHIASICQQVEVVSYLGEKNSKEKLIRRRLKPNVRPTFFHVPGQPTIIKRRFIDPAYFYKFFEECILDKSYLPTAVETKIAEYLNRHLKNYDLTIVVDYGHGFLSKKLIEIIADRAKFLAVNTQTNSANTGFNYIVKYPRVNYACLDEIEARLATQDNFSSIEEVLLAVSRRLAAEKAVVTIGPRGSVAYENGSGIKQVPSFTNRITDPMGSGDAFLAISSPCAAAGFPIELVSFIGNVAGSIAANIIGNKGAVERKELLQHVGYLLE